MEGAARSPVGRHWITLSLEEWQLRPLLPALALGRLRGAPTPASVLETLVAAHRFRLGRRARAMLPEALRPRWTSPDDLAKLFHLGSVEIGIPRDRLWRSAVAAATSPSELPPDAERAQSALLHAIAYILGIAEPNRHFLARHGLPLALMSGGEVRAVLRSWLQAERATMDEEILVGRLALPIDGVLRRPLPEGVDEERVLRGLASSVSLSRDEKRAILARAPRISRGQLLSLIQIFEEEQAKFADMDLDHRRQLRRLSCEHGLEWLALRDELRATSDP
jgi:hypothetical protein